MGMLSFVTWLPMIGAALLALMPNGDGKTPRLVALLVSGITLLLSIALFSQYRPETPGFQLSEYASWIPALGVSYSLGLDGLSLMLVILTTLLTFVAVVFGGQTKVGGKALLALVLVLETAMIGSFLSLDLILFFTFFELTLLPMYFLVVGWGGERRGSAANKFLLLTFAGSIFMLVGMIGLALRYQTVSGAMSFNILEIQHSVADGTFWTGALQAQGWLFWAFAVALLVKTPAFPFHAWIADTYSEAPIVAPILSCAMVKLGTYGLLRFCLPLFPEASVASAPTLAGLGVAGIVYGGIVACIQPDMRRMAAYSSLSHMGFIVLGVFSFSHIGMMGGALGQLTHGIIAGAMFLLIGFIFTRTGSTKFADLGGLKARMPVFAAIFLIVMLGSVGLPGTSGFVSEFLTLLGSFDSGYGGLAGLSAAFAAVAAFGVVLAAVYLLLMFQKTFYGPEKPSLAGLSDLKPWEAGLGAALAALIILTGFAPNLLTKPMESSIEVTRQMALTAAGKRPVWQSANSKPNVARGATAAR